MEHVVEIINCGYGCPFFNCPPQDAMECTHPYFKGKSIWDALIITQDNVYGDNRKLPTECPLKREDLVITYKLKQ